MSRGKKELSMATEGVAVRLTYFTPWLMGYHARHMYLLKMGFTSSTAILCVYNLDDGAVLLLLYVDNILLSRSDDKQVLQVIEKPKDRFDTVDLGDAKFLLGMGIHRNVHAGTINLSPET